jgi:hypothetical protein
VTFNLGYNSFWKVAAKIISKYEAIQLHLSNQFNRLLWQKKKKMDISFCVDLGFGKW